MTSEAKTFCERDRQQLNRMLKFRLPAYYFKVGIGLFLLSFSYMIVHKAFSIELEFIRSLARSCMVVGLLFCSLAREPFEDERTRLIRAQSYSLAFIIGVIYAVVQPFINYGVDQLIGKPADLNDNGVIGILVFMLFIQLGFFYSFKKNT